MKKLKILKNSKVKVYKYQPQQCRMIENKIRNEKRIAFGYIINGEADKGGTNLTT